MQLIINTTSTVDGIIIILQVNWCMETRQKLTLDLTLNSFPMSTTCNHKNYYGINICHLIADVSLPMHMKIQTSFHSRSLVDQV